VRDLRGASELSAFVFALADKVVVERLRLPGAVERALGALFASRLA
jgi:hypothetical protein